MFPFFTPYTECTSEEFTCSSGQCIPQSYTCDGVRDCAADGSDERQELCGEQHRDHTPFYSLV